MPPTPFRTWPQAIGAMIVLVGGTVLWFWLVVGGACQIQFWLFNDPTCT